MEYDPVELLWERDAARAALKPIQRENARLRELLKLADEAIMAEYRMRIADSSAERS